MLNCSTLGVPLLVVGFLSIALPFSSKALHKLGSLIVIVVIKDAKRKMGKWVFCWSVVDLDYIQHMVHLLNSVFVKDWDKTDNVQPSRKKYD